MNNAARFAFAVVAVVLGPGSSATADAIEDRPASDTTADPKLPVGSQQIELATRSGWYDEVAGIEAEIPECHPFHGNDRTCAAASREPAGDIWEVCEDDDTLIESGQAVPGCHEHTQHAGHAYRISCDAYCREAHAREAERQGFRGGRTYTGVCTTKKLACGGGMQNVGYCACAPRSAPPIDMALPRA